eukprot:scaffold45035_cov49-Attheya_sp.AAC.3
MGHGQKKTCRRTNNKKKNKHRTAAASAGQQQNHVVGNNVSSVPANGGMPPSLTTPPHPRPPAQEDLPQWDDYNNVQTTNHTPTSSQSSPSSNNGGTYKSLYSRYKEATQRFKEALQKVVPSDIFRDDRVNNLMDAVDYLDETKPSFDGTNMIQDLKLAIRVRKKVAHHVMDGGDKGHAYFLSVLLYCWAVLRTLQPQPTKNRRNNITRTTSRSTTNPMENPFKALSINDDDDNDDEDDLPSGPVPRPTSDEPVRLTLQEMIRGSDRNAAIIFLMTMDEIMGFNVTQYSKLKQGWRAAKLEGMPPSTIIEHLMETATNANFAIQYVASLEQELIVDHPHMNTVYRLMSVLVFPDVIDSFMKDMIKFSPLAPHFKESDAAAFLGDCLESGLRNQTDPTMNQDKLVNEFARTWQVPVSILKERAAAIKQVGLTQIPLKEEIGMNAQFFGLASSMGLKMHSWLPKSKFIGTGSRNILNTVRLLQVLSKVIQEREGRVVCKEGFFGKKWDEGKNKAYTITGDMDDFLMADALPFLIDCCYDGILSTNLPFEGELLPVFSQLKAFVKSPTQPVSWSLAFAVHTLLTSVFEMQGNGDVESLGRTAKLSFETYFDQIEWAMEYSKGHSQPKNWTTNLKRLLMLKFLATPSMKTSEVQSLRAFWNPLCAGTLINYIAYFSNVSEGIHMVDSFAQLRMTLHLYNALKVVGLLPPQGIEVLEWLDATFRNSKAIWEGPRPNRGSFVVRWWIAYGTKIEEAQRMSRETRAEFSSNSASLPKSATDHRGAKNDNSTRKMTPIQPEKLCKSYRRICHHDFSDVVDTYHKTESQRASPIYDHAVRVNDTLDAMEKDQRFLATNFTSLGVILNQFVVSLFKVLELQPIVDELVRAVPDALRYDGRVDGRRVGRNSWEGGDHNLERQTMVHIFARQILGTLDFSNLTHPIPLIAQTAAFMQDFFQGVNPSRVMYFIPVEEED